MEVSECLQGHPDLEKSYASYISRKQESLNEGIRIAACGIYNAGKSTLLNVLADHFEPGSEVFATGAARVTSKVSELRLADATLIDMPGIDGMNHDDEVAWQGVLSGDFYLYVHRLRSLEFEQSELQFLQLLREKVHGLPRRVVLVISQIDEIMDEAEAAHHEAGIRQTFTRTIGFEPKWVFPVSARRFIKGMAEKKQGLLRKSGIPQLRSWMNEMTFSLTQSEWEAFRADRFQTEKNSLSKNIFALVDSLDAKILDFKQRSFDRTHAFDQAAQKLRKKIDQSLDIIDAHQ